MSYDCLTTCLYHLTTFLNTKINGRPNKTNVWRGCHPWQRSLKSPFAMHWLFAGLSGQALVTQPMLQCQSNWTELRLMVSKSIFNVDSKNVSEKFLHCHSWKNVFFFQNLPHQFILNLTELYILRNKAKASAHLLFTVLIYFFHFYCC